MLTSMWICYDLFWGRIQLRRAPLVVSTALMLVFTGLAGCRGSAIIDEGTATLELRSPSFQGGEMPKKCTCDGGESSPALAWAAPPPGTQSVALIAVDRDSPLNYSFVHWVLYNLPADKRELSEGLPKQEQLPDGSRQGQNDFDKSGYGGPCPLGKSAHRYAFALYAVDTKLNLPAAATRKQVESALRGHILAHSELVGRYQH
jgi:Raf kinase inhibitor-like YbhB/YbcL family protein